MKILVFGGNGLVGSKFVELSKGQFEINAPPTKDVDILNTDQLSKVFEEFDPEVVINFAAYTNVEEAENQKDDKSGTCFKVNVEGAKNVAGVSKRWGNHLIHISTEYVYDGTKKEGPYKEDDQPAPINWYGQTKHLGDQFVLESGCASSIARISMPYSPNYELKKDVARFFLGELKAGNSITAIEDQLITPTLVDDIANALRNLVEKEAKGIYHISSTNHTSPLDFAYLISETFGLDSSLIKPISLDEYNKNKQAKLLRYSWLDPSKFVAEFGGGILHTVEEGIKIFKQEIDAG